MDLKTRRKQMTKLCNWLMRVLGYESGVALAKAIGVSQSSMSGHISENPDAAIPKDELKEVYCNFLNSVGFKNKTIACDKWTVAEFTKYLDSDYDPDAFIKYLQNEPIPIRMSVRDIHYALTESERLELVEFFIHDLKKNSYLTASYAS
jgi:hypothetical protein